MADYSALFREIQRWVQEEIARRLSAAGIVGRTISGGSISGPVDANARVTVKKDGAVVGTRRTLNLIEGTGVTLTVADDQPNEDVDVTIDAIGGAGGTAFDWYDAIVDGGCAGDGTTDDTAALQALINTVATAGGGTIYFPPGVYLIVGALQDAGGFNGQLLLPDVPMTSQQMTIEFVGARPAPYNGDNAGGMPLPVNGYSIIKSTLTGATGTAAMISGGQPNGSTDNSGITNVVPGFRNLILQCPTNSTLTCLNMSNVQAGNYRSVLVHCGDLNINTITQPTHSNAYGVKLPQWNRSAYTRVEGLTAIGFYTGILQGELVVGTGMGAAGCVYGIELPFMNHASFIESFGMTGCTYPINVTGEHHGAIQFYDAEHSAFGAGDWRNTVYDLNDPSDLFYGEIAWFGHAAGSLVVPDHSFVINGGANASTHELGIGSVHAAVALGADADTLLSISGQALSLDSQIANRIFAGPTSGVAADPTFRALTTGDIPDLSATYLTPAAHDARDHTGVPGGGSGTGEMLVQDGSSAPPVMLTNEAETDFLYADV